MLPQSCAAKSRPRCSPCRSHHTRTGCATVAVSPSNSRVPLREVPIRQGSADKRTFADSRGAGSNPSASAVSTSDDLSRLTQNRASAGGEVPNIPRKPAPTRPVATAAVPASVAFLETVAATSQTVRPHTYPLTTSAPGHPVRSASRSARAARSTVSTRTWRPCCRLFLTRPCSANLVTAREAVETLTSARRASPVMRGCWPLPAAITSSCATGACPCCKGTGARRRTIACPVNRPSDTRSLGHAISATPPTSMKLVSDVRRAARQLTGTDPTTRTARPGRLSSRAAATSSSADAYAAGSKTITWREMPSSYVSDPSRPRTTARSPICRGSSSSHGTSRHSTAAMICTVATLLLKQQVRGHLYRKILTDLLFKGRDEETAS